MTVEFVGPPAAGKSFLYAHLVAAVGSERAGRRSSAAAPSDAQPRSRVQARKVRDAVAFGIRHPRTAATVVRVVGRSRQRNRRDAGTKCVNLFAELRRAESGPANRVTEQGVLQAIWSLGLRSGKAQTQTLLQHCRPWLPHTALLITTERAEVLRRLQHRGGGQSRLDRAGTSQAETELARGDQLMSQLLQLWEGLDAGHRVIEVANTCGVDPATTLAPSLELIKQRMNGKEKQCRS